MRAAVVVLFAVLASAAPVGAQPLDADVLVQAGHEGRPDCGPPPLEPASLCNNTGAVGEIAWTPIVANEITRVLRKAGVRVLRVPADLTGKQYRVRDAVFIHFDGSPVPCATGASVGYPVPGNAYPPARVARSPALAAAWKALYAPRIPFRFMPDNFTPTLRGYYGFNHVRPTDGSLVIEGGEISCPAQRAWLATRLRYEADLIAALLAQRLGVTGVPLPAR